MECIICRRACARTMEFIILSMRKTENMVYSFDNKVPSSIMRKFIYKSGRTQSAQGRETCP